MRRFTQIVISPWVRTAMGTYLPKSTSARVSVPAQTYSRYPVNPKTDPLLISSMRQASCKYETSRLELKSSQTILAIKRCEGKKIGKVIKQSRSLIYKLGHICATRGIPVNDTCCVRFFFRVFF